MPVVRDIGDAQLTVNITIGIKFGGEPSSEGDKDRRRDMAITLAGYQEMLEEEVLDKMCEIIGYTKEHIDRLVNKREEKIKADAKAEKEGREAKAKRRAGT